MKYRPGTKVRVKEVTSGGNFKIGDIITIDHIGFEDDLDCYGAISPWDNSIWYLYEHEVEPCTNGDWIRSMDDDTLGSFITFYLNWHSSSEFKNWLKMPYNPNTTK